jgi:hypothetical protein
MVPIQEKLFSVTIASIGEVAPEILVARRSDSSITDVQTRLEINETHRYSRTISAFVRNTQHGGRRATVKNWLHRIPTTLPADAVLVKLAILMIRPCLQKTSQQYSGHDGG